MYNIFISYSHSNKLFAKKLFDDLKKYRPVLKLNGKKKLSVFLDEAEANVNDLGKGIIDAITVSEKMIVLCSPESKNSKWVDKELKLFSELHGHQHIIPVLIHGMPSTSFSELFKLVFPAEPWAVDFREEKYQVPSRNKNSWYHLLACIYGVSRAEIEQRERKRRIKNTAIISLLSILIIASTVFFIQQRNVKRSLEIAGEARKTFEADHSEIQKASQLAIKAIKISPAPQSLDVLKLICKAYFDRMPGMNDHSVIAVDSGWNYAAVATIFGNAYLLDLQTHRTIFLCGNLFPITQFKFSPNGKYLFSYSKEDNMMQIWNCSTGELSGQFKNNDTGLEPAVYFIPDGSGFLTSQFDENLFLRKYKDLKQGKEIQSTKDFNLLFHPSGSYFISWAHDINTSDTSIIICSCVNGERVWSYDSKNTSYDFVVFANHNTRLICHTYPENPSLDSAYFIVFDLNNKGIPVDTLQFAEKDFNYKLLFDGSNSFDQFKGSDPDEFLWSLRLAIEDPLAKKYPAVMGKHGLNGLFTSNDGLTAIGIINDSIPLLINLPELEIKKKIDDWKFGRIEKIAFSKDGESAFIMGREGVIMWSTSKQMMRWSNKSNCSDIYLSSDPSKLFIRDAYQNYDSIFLYNTQTGFLVKRLNEVNNPLYVEASGKYILSGGDENLYLYNIDESKIILHKNFYSKDSLQYHHDINTLSDSISPEDLLEIVERRLINCSAYK